MNGKILTVVFTERCLAENPTVYDESNLGGDVQAFGVSLHDRASILERLKGHGYIGWTK